MDADNNASPVKPLTHRETRLVILGVMLPAFMGSLDNTILASALPSIGRDFGDVHNLPWLITAYLIAATSVLPLHGKISDIKGRRFTILVSIALYMAGSLVCALAPSMFVLILGRILHGFGGGGLSAMGMVILGDIAAPKDRGRYYGYFSFIYSTAGGCGPLLGGFLSDYLHWSAIFWLNIGMGLVAIALTLTFLGRLPRRERSHRLDFLGAALIMIASVLVMLALSMGGVRYPWISAPIAGLAVAGLVIGAGFVWRLLTAPEPLIPLSILAEPVACYAVIAHGCGWASIAGLNIFLPMYLQNTMNYSASVAGLSLMVFMVALNTSGGFVGHWIGKATRYKIVPVLGLSISIATVLVLAWQAEHLTFWSLELLLAVIGIGFGGVPPLTLVALQNVVAPHQLGAAVSAMSFSRGLFSAMLIAIFGAIVLSGSAPADPGQIVAAGRSAAATSAADFARIFFATAGSLSITLICIILLEEKPLRGNHQEE